jgi:uncharacterized membrane protein HdeD (DUF308 family)
MAQTIDTTLEEKYATISTEVKGNRNWFLVLGVVTVLLGMAAIFFPFFASLAVELLIGWALVFSGVAGIVHAFRTSKWKGFVFSLLGALLSLGAGIVLLLYPLTGILSLTLFIAAFFLAGGVFRIILALRLRPFDHWGWLLFGGALDLVLAALILTQWPEAAAWIIGLLVGIDLIFAGWTMIMLAAAARRSS